MKIKSTIPTAVVALMAILAAAAYAQVEVLSPDQVKAFSARLPEVAANSRAPLLATYARKLQPASDTQTAVNAVRMFDDLVRADITTAAFFTYHVVPPLSPAMRLDDVYPVDGRPGGSVNIIAAQDEYEPASFVIYSFVDLDRVELTVSDLKAGNGATFPAANLDLKVVKVWYQNGNGWFSYFSDVGLSLVPELLLNDEKLIRVDAETKGNFARVRHQDGERDVWISAPREIDVPFNHYDPGFADAKKLQPVSLQAGRFKQFFLTAHVTAQTPPGIYRGGIKVTAAGHPAVTIPVTLRVLPFQLPLPKTYLEPDKDLMVSLMGSWPKLKPDHPAFMPTLKNLRRHNLLHTGPGIHARSPAEVADMVEPMKQAGFQTRPIISRHSLTWVGTHDGTPYTFDQLMHYKRAAAAWRGFYLRHFGHTDVYVNIGDEPTATWVMKTRRLWRVIHEQGLKVHLAGHDHLFTKAGYILDNHAAAGAPSDAENARTRHAVGHGYVSFYANQHNGSENPDFSRRQHGMLSYLTGYSAVHNYAFYYGPWNDLAMPLYKPMVLAYPISDGLVDTLAWEGFREAIDDVRYATELLRRARLVIDSGDLDKVYAGRQVLQWFALIDATTADLTALRMEMIDRILRFQ